MCWNAEVSLNTFLFSFFTLTLVYYNNEYTKYKNPIFENKWLYIFLLLTFLMQFIEFFIWKNLKTVYNSFLTKVAFILIYLQPIASLMLLSNITIRNYFLFTYIALGIPYLILLINSNRTNTTVSKNGHLIWNCFNNKIEGIKISRIAFSIWLFFLLFSLFYEQKWFGLLFGIITLSVFIYKEAVSSGSTWCWFVNSFSFYLLFYLLIYLPLKEKGIC